jgi:hypothetical protein
MTTVLPVVHLFENLAGHVHLLNNPTLAFPVVPSFYVATVATLETATQLAVV